MNDKNNKLGVLLSDFSDVIGFMNILMKFDLKILGLGKFLLSLLAILSLFIFYILHGIDTFTLYFSDNVSNLIFINSKTNGKFSIGIN